MPEHYRAFPHVKLVEAGFKSLFNLLTASIKGFAQVREDEDWQAQYS